MAGYLNEGTDDEGTDEASLQPVTVRSVKTGELSPLEVADMLRRSRVTSSEAAADLKTKIERARNAILSQPTKQSKADWLLGVGSTLLAPGPVGRAGTLGESIGALGKYVSDVTDQERKAKALQAQQLANFDLNVARTQAAAAKEEESNLATLASKYAQKTERIPASVSELMYWQNISDNPEKYPADLVAAAKVKVKEAKTEKKPEQDRSASAQFLNALTMSESSNPKVRDRGLALLGFLKRGSGSKLTLSMKTTDKSIDDARAAVKDIPVETINQYSRRGKFATAEQKKIVQQWNLAQRPKYSEVLAETEPDVIDVDMSGAPVK